MAARSLYESAQEACEIFRTFREGEPDLVDLGIPHVRETIGGMFQGNLVVIAAAQNCGKSSFLRTMGMLSRDKGGVLSAEDGPDVWGARLLAAEANVRPTDIRRKDLTEDELERIREALGRLRERDEAGLGPVLEYRIAPSVEDIEQGAENLAKAGCRWAAFDYLQKGRGTSLDRRNEVGMYLTHWQRACVKNKMVPVVFSQLVRIENTKEPYSWMLKESGDIENEARMIIMLWRDTKDPVIVRGKVEKSTFGGGGQRFSYRFEDSEALMPVVPEVPNPGDF